MTTIDVERPRLCHPRLNPQNRDDGPRNVNHLVTRTVVHPLRSILLATRTQFAIVQQCAAIADHGGSRHGNPLLQRRHGVIALVATRSSERAPLRELELLTSKQVIHSVRPSNSLLRNDSGK